jgi:hypothetical protein
MNKIPQKLYIVKKYILAKSASDAIRKDKKTPVDDCWMDEDFKKQLSTAIGFAHYSNEED